jgi:sigma-E factor negative regulatory protein RseA
LSALFDGELPETQAELVIRRALKDPQLRSTWGRYALIGAALRNEPLAVRSRLRDDVASRVGARLSVDSEPAHSAVAVTASGPAKSRAMFARGAWGMGIAASVAAVSLLVLRAQVPDAAAPVQMAASNAVTVSALQPDTASEVIVGSPEVAQVAVVMGALPSYTTPVDNSPAGQRVSAPLVNYIVAHSEVSASAVRFSPLSSVMSASYDPAQGTVEMTEAEIGAHR